ncbi:hypothetical protein SD81_035040 [Tolypothrix campylonemoides VB511288]|nr:hypothetical protein SD81_035040 [Tolypothrix campylonemoides VB511288]
MISVPRRWTAHHPQPTGTLRAFVNVSGSTEASPNVRTVGTSAIPLTQALAKPQSKEMMPSTPKKNP